MSTQFTETVRSFLSPIVPYLDDPDVTEIMINSPEEIWIEKNGKVEQTDARFDSAAALMSAVNNISQFVKRRINEETPTMDARLPDGSRIHAILPPCARKGICLPLMGRGRKQQQVWSRLGKRLTKFVACDLLGTSPQPMGFVDNDKIPTGGGEVVKAFGVILSDLLPGPAPPLLQGLH